MRLKLLFALILSAASINAQTYTFPRISPDPLILEIKNYSNPLPADIYLIAAIYLSGADDTAVNQSIETVNSLLSQFQNELSAIHDPYERSRILLQLLHTKLFTSYSELQTKLDVLLSNGVFNCVSSAVLYTYFARMFQLEVKGSATADHAFCSVIINGESIDVETTTVHGFDPGMKVEFTDNFGSTTGYAYVPPGDYTNRFDVDDFYMLSYILQNRIVVLQRNHKYYQSVSLAVDRYFLLKDETSSTEMFLEFQNYISLLNNQKSYEEGIAFIAYIVKNLGNKDFFKEHSDTLVHNLYLQAMNSGDLSLAASYLDEYGPLISEPLRESLISSMAALEINSLLQNAEYEFAEKIIYEKYESGIISEPEYKQFISILYSNISIIIAANEGNLDAYIYVQEGIALAGKTSFLTKASSVHLQNAVIDIHNKFVVAYNNADYSQAEKIVREGLELFPGNSRLKSDLRKIPQ